MAVAFDRRSFFDAVRSSIFHGLTDTQVGGCEAILAEAERRAMAGTQSLAYLLATAFWESGRRMTPVREIDRGRGKPYGIADPETRQVYYGRGLVQLTWKANYAKMARVCAVDLVATPDLALEPDVAVTILFEGMLRGLFTGKTLADYFDGASNDWVEARRIVNGTDKAQEIAAIARDFDAALRSAARAPPAVPKVLTMAAVPRSLATRIKHLFSLGF